MTVLVVGASGTTGSAVVHELTNAGAQVRAVTRSGAKADTMRRPGVEVIVTDGRDPAALRAAFAGVQAAYVATSSAPDMHRTEELFAQAAAAAGAHLVKLSVIGASADSPLRFSRMHAGSESAIEATGGPWTFLQPNGFMQNDLAWAAQVPSGTVAGPVMDASWSIVDARDIAAVAVEVLLSPTSHAGRRIAITGPQARTPRDRVAALGAILGRDLAVVDVPISAARQQLLDFGVPAWDAEGLAELFELYAQGLATGVAPDAAAILGRPGRTWETFATDHAAVFRGSAVTA